MKDILFKNATFHRGLNCTVRSGLKHTLELRPGDVLRLVDVATKQPAEHAAVIAVSTFNGIVTLPTIVYEFEHDPYCKSQGQLALVLDEMYGKEWIDQPLTVIWFWV